MNIDTMSMEEAQKLYTKLGDRIFKESRKKTEKFIEKSTTTWKLAGLLLRKEREELKLSQKYIASAIGCSESKVSSFERGEPVMSSKMMQSSYENVIKLEKLKKAWDREIVVFGMESAENDYLDCIRIEKETDDTYWMFIISRVNDKEIKIHVGVYDEWEDAIKWANKLAFMLKVIITCVDLNEEIAV